MLFALATGCAAPRSTPTPRPDLATHVDLSRFMGDWYVIANIPTFLEKGAHDAVESYTLRPDGRIATTFRFRKGAFSGPQKTYHPIGTVHDRATQAEWRMQFLWPFQAAYLIHHVDPAYKETLIGVPNRRHAWIMARTPQIPDDAFASLAQRLATLGYDTNRLERVPQSRR